MYKATITIPYLLTISVNFLVKSSSDGELVLCFPIIHPYHYQVFDYNRQNCSCCLTAF